MVFRTLSLACEATKKWKRQLKFIDTLRLHLKGGHGGNGYPKYGGQGGQGGCIYFIAEEKATLKGVIKKFPNKHIEAGFGECSNTERLIGRRGTDIVVPVPPGVKVFHESGKMLGELNASGQRCIAAGGGIGGCSGNNFIGGKGYAHTVVLDLSLIADVGLVGFPNAGKSTFLKAISRASPRIANYPFTTIRPQIGIVEYKDYRQVSVADLPGLIEGAHLNVGMGYKFLKHVERTRLLVLIVDLFGFQLSASHQHRTCLENIFALNKELELYNTELLKKPAILLLNKIDVEGSEKQFDLIRKTAEDLSAHVGKCRPELIPNQFIKFDAIEAISAKELIGIEESKELMRRILDDYAAQKLAEEEMGV